MSFKMVVIGGTAAGLSAAAKAKRLDPAIDIKVFEKSAYVSYGSCGLPYYVGGMIGNVSQLIALTLEELREERGLDVRILHEVTRIDRASKTVEVTNAGGAKEEKLTVPYDKLVVATGARASLPPIPGVLTEGGLSAGVHVLRNLDDGIALKKAAAVARRAVIVGAGFIGIELAEQLKPLGLDVEIVEMHDSLLPAFPEDYSQRILALFADRGVAVHLGTAVREIALKQGAACGVVLDDGRSIAGDLVIVAAGATPETGLARDCGLALGIRNAIAVTDTLQTADASIWACGDCVESTHILTGEAVYLPLGTHANKQGRVAGSNIAGRPDRFPGVLGSQVTKLFETYIASTGLGEREARAHGFDAASSAIVQPDRPGYYPGGRENRLNLVFDRRSGRILGAQGIGGFSVAGRINVLIAAITAGMDLEVLNSLDLLYTPAVAPVYDPLLIAASSAMKKLG